jgi:hypothetical protein
MFREYRWQFLMHIAGCEGLTRCCDFKHKARWRGQGCCLKVSMQCLATVQLSRAQASSHQWHTGRL